MNDFSGKIETHQQNKREAFDGMRAYHNSEISHKGHAIEILKTLLTAILTIYLGLTYSSATGAIQASIVVIISLVSLLGVSVCASLTVWSTNQKIDHDNRRYEQFREEYKHERKILGLDEDLKNNGFDAPIQKPENRKKSGYNTTKMILRVFCTYPSSNSNIGHDTCNCCCSIIRIAVIDLAGGGIAPNNSFKPTSLRGAA